MLGLPQIIARSCAGLEARQADVAEQLAAVDQIGQAAGVLELFARHGRVIDQLSP
jgi:hypothetical protein